MLSLGEDKTFKLWNIGSEHQGLYSEFMFDNPLCATLHPYSIQCAIGYKDSVRIFYILEQKLKCVFNHPLSKMCRCVAYCEGGNYLAAGHGGKISIFDAYNWKTLTEIKAHSNDVVNI
jgi:WD40 repeat protein